MNIGTIIMHKRKALGLTQQALAEQLHISFQAISKWENGTSNPEIELLPEIAAILGTSVDALLGYKTPIVTDYEHRYQTEEVIFDCYSGGKPKHQHCMDIMIAEKK